MGHLSSDDPPTFRSVIQDAQVDMGMRNGGRVNTNGSNFFLMRHGETEKNRMHVWQCTTDSPLNENGKNQAREAIPVINSIQPEYVITSSLSRAKETARIACSSLENVEYIEEKRFMERSCGSVEGMTTDEIRQKYGLTMDIVRAEIDIIPGVEPYTHFLGRVMEAVEHYTREFAGRKVLVVSHGGVMRTFYDHNIAPIPHGMVFRNCSIISVAKNSHSWELVSKYNTEQI